MAGGVGGVPPRNFKRGRAAYISNPATSGTQNAGEPSAYEGGKTGVQGGEAPMAGGVGGVPPQNIKRGRVATLATPPRVGPKTLANPQPTRVGKRGVQGGEAPMAGGVGGVPPRNFKRGRVATLATPPRVGPKTLANPQPTRVGKRGVQGAKPPGGGSWGVSPHETLKGDEQPTLATPPRVGPKTLANPQPTRVGKRGVQGGEAPSQGAWGMCPPKPKRVGNSLNTHEGHLSQFRNTSLSFNNLTHLLFYAIFIVEEIQRRASTGTEASKVNFRG
jgi:hypothetical protein